MLEEPATIELSSLNDSSAPPGAQASNNNNDNTPSEIPESTLESQNRESAVALPPVDGGMQAWTFVAAAFVLEALVWGFGSSYGIFQDYYTHNPPFNTSSETAIAAVGTVGLAIPYIEVIGILVIYERWPHITKPTMWVALAVSCGSLALSSFATKVWHLIILQGVVFGMAGGALYAPVLVWLSEWFVRRRGLAGSIIFGGLGAGGAVFPLLINGLLSATGSWQWTLRILALVIAVSGSVALWFVKPRVPIVRRQQGQVKPVNMSFMKTPLYLSVEVTIFIQAIAYFPVSLYMPTYTSAVGLPIINGTVVLAVFNIASVVGQVIFGHLCDRMPYTRVMIISGVGSALSAYLLWGFAHSLWLIFLFVVVFGAVSGGFSSVWPTASTDIAGTETPNSVVVGAFGIVKGIAAIIGPIIATSLHHPDALPSPADNPKNFGGYGFTAVTLFVGGMMVATTAGGVISLGVKRWADMIHLARV